MWLRENAKQAEQAAVRPACNGDGDVFDPSTAEGAGRHSLSAGYEGGLVRGTKRPRTSPVRAEGSSALRWGRAGQW